MIVTKEVGETGVEAGRRGQLRSRSPTCLPTLSSGKHDLVIISFPSPLRVGKGDCVFDIEPCVTASWIREERILPSGRNKISAQQTARHHHLRHRCETSRQPRYTYYSDASRAYRQGPFDTTLHYCDRTILLHTTPTTTAIETQTCSFQRADSTQHTHQPNLKLRDHCWRL